MFKVNNRNTRTTFETVDQVWNIFKVNNKDTRAQNDFMIIVNFEHISHLLFVVSTVSFEQANAGWVIEANTKTEAQKNILKLL